jgi:hypothetical protein
MILKKKINPKIEHNNNKKKTRVYLD